MGANVPNEEKEYFTVSPPWSIRSKKKIQNRGDFKSDNPTER